MPAPIVSRWLNNPKKHRYQTFVTNGISSSTVSLPKKQKDMEKKQINLSNSVFSLVHQYPEIVEIMADLGFTEIRKKSVVNSIGKLMTIPKGAKMKHIDLGTINKALEDHGFEVVDQAAAPKSATPSIRPLKKITNIFSRKSSLSEERMQLLKSYLRRLGTGEDLEAVRADFVANFKDVEASDIMKAEQELIAEGQPVRDVQKLCDVHSALFHGNTREEQIANAEKAAEEGLRREQAVVREAHENRSHAEELIAIPGHPLSTFTQENDTVKPLILEAEKALEEGRDIQNLLPRIREIALHYAKKGDLLYPLLATRYDITGPSQVMWSVDDEIRDALARLVKAKEIDGAWKEKAAATLQRAREMIYKERNILFPICAAHFTDAEWQQIYHDSQDYPVCLRVEHETWEEAEKAPAAAPETDTAAKPVTASDEIVLPGGHFTLEQLRAMLNTLPLEISFVDADDYNRFFNEGPKLFKRPSMAIDRKVFSCHPPKIQPMVQAIINDFREGRRDEVPVWMEKNGRTVYVNYMAVRDTEGHYVGTLEVVQDMEFAKKHFLH